LCAFVAPVSKLFCTKYKHREIGFSCFAWQATILHKPNCTARQLLASVVVDFKSNKYGIFRAGKNLILASVFGKCEGKGLTLRPRLRSVRGSTSPIYPKIENERIPYTPAVETIRQLADALSVDSIECSTLAGQATQGLGSAQKHQPARRFFDPRARFRFSGDWEAFLDLLEERQAKRGNEKGGSKKEK